jgi:hypothetical protein
MPALQEQSPEFKPYSHKKKTPYTEIECIVQWLIYLTTLHVCVYIYKNWKFHKAVCILTIWMCCYMVYSVPFHNFLKSTKLDLGTNCDLQVCLFVFKAVAQCLNWRQIIWVQMPALPLPNSKTDGRLHNFCDLVSLSVDMNIHTYFVWLL